MKYFQFLIFIIETNWILDSSLILYGNWIDENWIDENRENDYSIRASWYGIHLSHVQL